MRRNTSAGQNVDAAGRLVNQLTQPRRAIQRKCGATACEDHGDAEIYQSLEGRALVGDLIEGAMETDRHWPRSGDEFRHHRAVDLAINGQRAKDDARSAGAFRVIDIAEHDGDVMAVVHEVAGAGPDENMDGLRDELERAPDETGRRGHSAIVKRAAQLNAVHAFGVSSQRAADRLDGSFNEEGSGLSID